MTAERQITDPKPGASLTIATAAVALRRGDVSSASLTEACLAQIAARDRSLNAFILVLADDARKSAADADRELASGIDRGRLHGIPISLKDIFDVTGTPTTAASHVREGHVAAVDAAIVTGLRRAGAVIVGKTNLHEFALGTTNEESAYGPAHHPLDDTRSPGGSSGGSAVSVAADMAFASIGTDTGGSVRIPAAACGLVGLKPSWGDLSTDGVVPLSTTLDHVGPLSRSVSDARLLYHAMRGDALPEESSPGDVRGMRFGVLRGYFSALLEPQIRSLFETACARLREAGALLEDVDVPHAADISAIYLHIALAEAAAYHAPTLEARPELYTPTVRLRLEMGRYLLAEDYVRALRGRGVLVREVNAALSGRRALVLPTLPIPAPKLGVATVRLGGGDEPVRNVMLRLTQLFNITGHPAITIPCGATAERLPAGLQLVGASGCTVELLSTAAAVEPHVGPGTSG